MITQQISDEVRELAELNKQAMFDRCRESWRHVDAPDVCDWIESKLRFGTGDGDVQLESRVGPFTFDDTPWWRFIVRSAVAPECQSIALPAATQTHKTANFLIAIPLYLAEFKPAPAMIVVPDEGEAKKIRNRIYAVVQESRKFTTFERLAVQPEHKWNLQEIHLGSMLIHLAWAGSKSKTRSKPCHYVFFTEVDVYRDADQKSGDPVEAGKQRTKDVLRYKHLFESSPSEKPSTICDEEKIADERWRWYVTCPHCGRKQEPRFFLHKKGKLARKGGIEFTIRANEQDGDALLEPRQARTASYYVCESGCKIANDYKRRMVEAGEWYPLGWRDGDAEPERRPCRTMGFHLWAMHSPNETFGTIAEDYLRHKKKGQVVDFFGNRLAISYESETRAPTWMELGRRAAYTNARRTVPDACWFLTAGIDKQGDNNGSRYVIRGWAPNRTSYLVDWGWVSRDEFDEGPILGDLLEVEKRVLASDFACVTRDNEASLNPLGRSRLRVRLANIDTNHLPRQIHRWMRQLAPNWLDRLRDPNRPLSESNPLLPGRLRAVRGDRHVRPDVRFRHNLVETHARSGEKYEGGLHQWGICVYPYYQEQLDCISTTSVGHDGSWYVTSDALALGKEYLQQLTNFHYATTFDKRRGRRSAWVPRVASIPVDFWDCEIYAAVAAEMVVGDMGWSEDAWEIWRGQSTKQQKRSRSATSEVADIGSR